MLFISLRLWKFALLWRYGAISQAISHGSRHTAACDALFYLPPLLRSPCSGVLYLIAARPPSEVVACDRVA